MHHANTANTWYRTTPGPNALHLARLDTVQLLQLALILHAQPVGQDSRGKVQSAGRGGVGGEREREMLPHLAA